MDTTCNVANRTIFMKDNLDVLQKINSRCIDLIYLDPPFNKNKVFAAPIGSSAEGAEFKDIFREEDVKDEWLQTISEDQPELHNYLNGIKGVGKRYNFAYLAYMAIRLIECQRVLKPTGSIYLHCDPTMSHYLKTTMDCIFGEDNFRNELVWERTKSVGKGSQHASRTFGANSDSILFYSASASSKLDANRELTVEEIQAKFPKVDRGGRRYNTDTPLWRSKGMGSRPNLCYEYRGWRNPHPSGWRISKANLIAMDKRGEIIWRDPQRPLRKTFADSYRGTRFGNVWVDINPTRKSSEATGYPTQKPLALLERIIKASSSDGDIVLDPFAGCATTCIAAERLGRQWIGIDVSHKAYDLVKERLNKEVARPDELFGEEVHLTTKLPVRLGESLGETKHVYIISHPNYPGEYKVGIAKNVKARLNAYQTSDPDRAYKLEFSHETHLFRETEKHIHEVFENKHEWVNSELAEIKQAIVEFGECRRLTMLAEFDAT